MGKDSGKKKAGQAKKPFVVHNTPVWLDQEQNWITAGGRRLYKTLRTLADVKTGRLFIPGRGWISLRTIEARSGFAEDARLKYQRELQALGAIHIHRDYVIRVIKGRKRKVLGIAQITVLPLTPPPRKQRASTTPGRKKPKTGARSTTPGIDDNAKSPHPERVSTTPGVDKTLLHPDFTAPVESGYQYLSETTNMGARGVAVDAAVAVGSAVGVGSGVATDGHPGGVDFGPGAQAPMRESGGRRQVPPAREYPYPPETAQIIEHLETMLRSYSQEFPNQPIPIHKLTRLRKLFLDDTNALGIPFPAAPELFEATLRKFLNPAPATPPTPEPQPHSVARGQAQKLTLAHLRQATNGLSSAELAVTIFGEETYKNRDRIVGVIASLRRAGHRIQTVGSDNHRKRFVLKRQSHAQP